METYSFGIITPSYAPDFERCRLLSESIDRYATGSVRHYIVVDRRDVKLFRQLRGINREIITVESVLPWWIKKIPLLKNGWFSFKSLPIRNWLLQQIVKLAIAEYISDDVLIFVDSDVAFIRQFDVRDFIKDGQVRLFKEPKAIAADNPTLAKWCDAGSHFLSLPPVRYPTANYLGNIITWKRDNVLLLHRYLESISGRGWIETIASTWHLSEYMLYGIFVDSVLKDRGQHYYDSQKLCYEYWRDKPMSDAELGNFFTTVPSDVISVMISAKAQIPIERYIKFIEADF